mgnify:CR=1 FL=1
MQPALTFFQLFELYNDLSCAKAHQRSLPSSTLFINDELINTTTVLYLSSGTRDAHPLRREAVTPNGKTRDANATTQSA